MRRQKEKVRYSEIIPRTQQWPIVQLAKDRKAFIEEVTKESFESLKTITRGRSLREELEMTVYREKLRMKANPWRVDPKDEKPFWKSIQDRLVDSATLPAAEAKSIEEGLLYEIIHRYADEIAGNFKKNSYRFARAFITFGFARLLNATRVKGFTSLFSKQLDLDDKIHIVGEPEHIRALAKKGTVVMVPTHFSNLDSILIGWVIQFLGLPAFIYGAGLNLFNLKIFAYFMNSLGAYKVDRRKKNPVYLETLKTYSSMALRRGCHSLFFPGGTRSRSGQIEKALKLGLLSTTIEAQRIMYQQETEEAKARKIFVVPVVINYNFTLEAPALINEHLKRTGQERYYKEADEFTTSYKIASFLFKFFTKGSNISVTIGKGMDILGNYVDMEGHSLDSTGAIIHPKDYFISQGQITVDHQREQEYVRILAKRIVEEYHKYNRVFASHLVAYTAFKMMERKNPKLDLYNLLRLPDEDTTIDYEEFKKAWKKLRKRILKLEKKGKVGVADHMKAKANEAIEQGLNNLGMYHAQRPLIKKGDKVIIQDMNTLYYYHNRMEGYGLEKHI
ncbi:MAG: acyltransferase [Flammeovirgaceae bacterium]|nr:acyltransferase [Flammeovirgaceae bacterium]MBE62152.1 acyltransferase [Flammeovirgaceae bacterium]MBR10626.1 acyltransferase [Rickettsiales bacterium]HCX22407.1 acyltransferase [Cytophagales bacterium]|tara:strand:+ start:5473 stop:7155 length:1683 start_codon:yes stop_codon:yes gene_type:complete